MASIDTYYWSMFVIVNQSWADRLREPAVNHNTNQGGRDLMVWAVVGTELKMDKRKKHPGGTEKLRLKKLKSLEVEAAKCSKLSPIWCRGYHPNRCCCAGRRASGGIYAK